MSNTKIINTSSLIGYWPFENGSGSTVSDKSGNGNDATISNGSCTFVQGKIGGGMNFTGNDTYAGLSSTVIQATSAFSVAVWVKLAVTQTTYQVGGYVGIVANTANTDFPNKGFSLYLPGPTVGQIEFIIGNGTTFGYTDSIATNYNDNTWHFVVATYLSPNTPKIYVDGVNVSTGGLSVTYNAAGNTTSAMRIGEYAFGLAGNPRAMIGSIDEVKIFNRELSANEISYLYYSKRPQ